MKAFRKLREFLSFWRAWSRQQELVHHLRAHHARLAGIKARVVSIGEIWPAPHGNGVILGPEWEFDCSNGAMLNRVDDNGTHYFCGYTAAELREIHAHRQEWEPLRADR